ncbi:MAG: hypothetical protein KJ904_00015 [Alphaproteobacteria bacterium]|uniref:Uncharacterized protein n=1 Tax=viral metagenome TaxID=1070528 RepID=A0A6M3LTH1_9ZZZZ|nr:hypothetical protein [Alphaproteobacteria bacterium]MBU0798643.1 hypothetical protein [Alphaproteobacteria bacterium]MBU0885527.1 hypothetical protein [Alphaproteobacteria bacterium]MBU1811895.1 hypothetical protein [Alphaproteobacteria bacterium]MBU2090457.1 hypothetical protein [Alphaproteobacteria bacterium]
MPAITINDNLELSVGDGLPVRLSIDQAFSLSDALSRNAILAAASRHPEVAALLPASMSLAQLPEVKS